MLAFYGNPLSEHLSDSPEGFLICKSVPIARVGKMEYLARELGLDGDPERIITVNRYPEDVFADAAIASFEGKDITDNHPPVLVDANSYQAFSRGHVQNVRRDGDYLVADLVIKDPALANDVRNGVKREISCGYNCDFVADGDGYKQVNIRGNHVAVVPSGRAGAAVAIKDSAQARKGKVMSKRTHAILNLFRVAATDSDPETLAALTEDAAAMLDAEPSAEPEAEPIVDVKVESVPKGDDLGSKLDALMERVATLESLVKKEDPEEELKDEAAIEPEIIDACAEDTDGMLKAVREAVSKISNPEEKSAVVDALLKFNKTDMSGIIEANEASAKAAADAVPDTAKLINEITEAYRDRNPHTKKEG